MRAHSHKVGSRKVCPTTEVLNDRTNGEMDARGSEEEYFHAVRG